ncbi:hypothetical protein ACJW31_06G229000 [Castanea mollissima]
MILNSAVCIGMAVPCTCRPPFLLRPMCLSSNINTEQLRAQLDQLHSEAARTTAKEAAEKIQRQAAISVQTGKENDARELLIQKKKVKQALEKSKSRIELLDELSTKLNKAISLKESQLVGNVALDFEVGNENAPSPVRIITPKQENKEDLNENVEVEPHVLELDGQQDLQLCSEIEESLPVDQELSKIEAELVTVLRVSTLVLDSKETPKNSKVQQTQELLESICGIRKRIASIKLTKVETR